MTDKADIKVIDASRSVFESYRAALRLVTDWGELGALTEQLDGDTRLTLREREELVRFAESKAAALRPRSDRLRP